MNRLLVILFALIWPLLGMPSGSEQKLQKLRNRSPSIESFTSSSRTVDICPFSGRKPEVELFVQATDVDADPLNYEYSVNEGTISGRGNLVVWNLDGLPRGPHKVRVTVSDEKGGKVDATLTVTTVDAGICDPPRPPCPVIELSCPTQMDKSKLFVFSAVINGNAEPYKSVSFDWTLNAGRIVKGQNSREIEVTTTGANGFDKITATVDVGGFDPSCVTAVSCSTKIIW